MNASEQITKYIHGLGDWRGKVLEQLRSDRVLVNVVGQNYIGGHGGGGGEIWRILLDGPIQNGVPVNGR